jgi:hypothetical protein
MDEMLDDETGIIFIGKSPFFMYSAWAGPVSIV